MIRLLLGLILAVLGCFVGNARAENGAALVNSNDAGMQNLASALPLEPNGSNGGEAAKSSPKAKLPEVQQAFFYQERTRSAAGNAEPGSVVWSLIQEPSGAGMPPESAIQAEATIPGADVQLRMTIKRNTDKTLPASHIIELNFQTPKGFEGGGFDSLPRIAMKGSEREPGSALLAVSAKVAHGFFIVALLDNKPDTKANLQLLQRSWIDVPVIYKSGRRALFTMQKGTAGTEVFDHAMAAWQTASE